MRLGQTFNPLGPRRVAGACLLGFLFVAPLKCQTPSRKAILLASLSGQSPDDSQLLRQALELDRLGKCEEAETLLNQILLDQPRNIAVRKLLANCFLKEKKIDEARKQFQLVLEDAPQDVEALGGLQTSVAEVQKREQLKQTLAIQRRTASAEELRASHEFLTASKLLKARRWDEAEKILESLAARHPDSIPVRLRLAEIFSSTRRFDQAAEMYRALAERRGAQSVFLLRTAQNLEWSGNSPEAARYYRLYLTRQPQDLAARKELADVLMWSAHYREAVTEYEQIRARKPDDLEVQMALANTLLWSGHYREAIPELERLRAQQPGDLKVHLALAQSYEQVGDAELAVKAYDRVLALDPSNSTARAARDKEAKFLDELPRQEAFAALERRDYEGAASEFIEYLRTHPNSNGTVLQIARVYSWAKRFPEAERFYEEYLRREPLDFAVMRELAKVEMWTKNYAGARKHFELLTRRPDASTEDYENLIHAFVWDRDLDGAQPYAVRLAALDPNNSLARQTLRDFAERQKLVARTRAEELAAERRYPAAVEAYRHYMETYGKDPKIELLICRLYSWDTDYTRAAEAYREYLRENPQDLDAHLELANVENWSGHYDAAEAEYRAVLDTNPREVAALVGIARVLDYQGKDPFRVRDRYRQVLTVEPGNTLAQNRLEEIHSLVAPTLGYSENSFWDTDRLLRTNQSIEMTFPLPGHLKLTPFYTFGFFRQRTGEVSSIIFGNGGGGRIEISRSRRWILLGEAGLIHFDFDRAQVELDRRSLNARAEFVYRPGGKGTVGLTYGHHDAIYDLNSFATLASGIMSDTFQFSYQRPLFERARFWISGGASHYSQVLGISDNWQPRLSARLDFQLQPWLSLGYSGRATGFSSRLAGLYFSPWHYQTHGLAYTLSHRLSKRLRVNTDGEADYGRITTNPGLLGYTVNTFEFAILPNLSWQARRGWALRLGYRFTRGAGSAFSRSLIYRTEGIDFGLSRAF